MTWLTAGLDPNGFETRLITGTVPPGEGDMSWFAREAGINPVIIPEMSRELSPKDLLVIFKLLREMIRFKPDIIHTHKAKAGAAGRSAGLIYKLLTGGRCKIIHTYHGHIFHSYYGKAKTSLFIAIERALARFATDIIITISEQQREEIHGLFRVGKFSRHRVIPLGIDFDQKSERLGSLKSDPDIPLIGIVGRLCEVKNHSLFIDAIHELRQLGANARAVIIGDGHLRPALESQAQKLQVADKIVFTGFRDDVLSLYNDLDIVGLTSLNEGTPLTLIEAMSCGVPAVSTEVGGVVDLMGQRLEILDGMSVWEHGLTVPSGNSLLFARAMKYLIDNPQTRKEMGLRARSFVRSHLSKERLIGDIENLYSNK
ncbi:MAG: glycosyltransferase [Acidobacteria bacterium]|nr:glycosyltransferase [Acidobacteriota bacterium]